MSVKRASSRRLGLLLAGAAVVISVVVALVMTNGFEGKSYTFTGIPYNPPEQAPDFNLIDQDNQPFRLSDYRGKVLMLFFGFTHCPEACPLTLGIWNRVHELLEDDVEAVQFVFITIDPERDTPEQLKKHLSLFNPDIIGLTGSTADIEDVATDYSVYFERVELESSEDYWVNHTTLTFVIDQSGNLVLTFPYATTAEQIVADLEHILR